MRNGIFAVLLFLASGLSLAQDAAANKDAPAADKASHEAAAADAARSEQAKDEEFKPPPGFRTKKRGKLVLYCIQDSTVGTRFKTEKCYDEAQLHDYLIAREENKRDMERVRSTCSSGVSGGPCVHQ